MRKFYFILFVLCIAFIGTNAQQNTLHLNKDYNLILEREIQKADKPVHTAAKPYLFSTLDSVIHIDSAVKSYFKTATRPASNLFLRKLTQEHLFSVNQANIRLFVDPLFDFSFGKEFSAGNIYTNTRGIQLGGDIGSKFSFYTAFYENWAKFPGYVHQYIKNRKVVPGQSIARINPTGAIDFGVPYGYISYTPNQYFNFQLGQGKNFFGDGYRSMFLSDGIYTYPYFKITTSFWKIQYTNLWSQFLDSSGGFKFTNTSTFPKKYASYQFLSLQATKRLNINLFQSIVWSADSAGKRGIEWAYINPIIYFNTLNFNMGSPDNSLMGIGFNYKLIKSHKLYGQLIIDDFNLSKLATRQATYFQEKYAYQLGWKYFDVLSIPNLYFQAEFNRSRPYVYTHRTLKINYTHLNEPIAHPLGANFNELILSSSYKWRKLNVNVQLQKAKYGADIAGSHWGKNIFLSDYDAEYGPDSFGNTTGQGIKTNLTNIQAKVAYLLNPKTNLKIEAGFNTRSENSYLKSTKTSMLYFGIKTAINNFYYDF